MLLNPFKRRDAFWELQEHTRLRDCINRTRIPHIRFDISVPNSKGSCTLTASLYDYYDLPSWKDDSLIKGKNSITNSRTVSVKISDNEFISRLHALSKDLILHEHDEMFLVDNEHWIEPHPRNSALLVSILIILAMFASLLWLLLAYLINLHAISSILLACLLGISLAAIMEDRLRRYLKNIGRY